MFQSLKMNSKTLTGGEVQKVDIGTPSSTEAEPALTGWIDYI